MTTRTSYLKLVQEPLSEHTEQCDLINMCREAEIAYPELSVLYAIPNGGYRHPMVGAKLKAEGVRKSMPDLCLPIARGGYNNLYIELKRVKGSYANADQKAVHERLRSFGNAVYVCKGCAEAWDEIVRYLDRK